MAGQWQTSCKFAALGNRFDVELNLAAGGWNGRLEVSIKIEELGRIVVPVADYCGDVSGEFLTLD